MGLTSFDERCIIKLDEYSAIHVVLNILVQTAHDSTQNLQNTPLTRKSYLRTINFASTQKRRVLTTTRGEGSITGKAKPDSGINSQTNSEVIVAQQLIRSKYSS